MSDLETGINGPQSKGKVYWYVGKWPYIVKKLRKINHIDAKVLRIGRGRARRRVHPQDIFQAMVSKNGVSIEYGNEELWGKYRDLQRGKIKRKGVSNAES